MGSLVVLDYLIERPPGLAGAVISGVAIEPAGVGSPALIAIAKTLSGIVPRVRVKLSIPSTALTRDPNALAANAADEHLGDHATLGWGGQTLRTVERIKAHMAEIDLPLLIVHGGADPLNMPSGAQALYDTVASADKTLKVYPGVLHEPHNDLGHEQLAADVIAWLDRLTGAATSAA
jgi:alpha-beta hydrolase superfamily lysophospholipase